MKNQISGRRLDFEKIFWYNDQKNHFYPDGFSRRSGRIWGASDRGDLGFGKTEGDMEVARSSRNFAYGVVRAEKRALTAVAGPFWELALYRFKARLAAKNLEPLDRTKIPAMTPMVGRAAL